MTTGCAQEPSWCWFWVFKISSKIRVLKQSQSKLLWSVSHMTILFDSCDECKRSNVLNVCHKLWATWWQHVQVCPRTKKNVWSTNARQIQAFENNLWANFWHLSNRSYLFFFELMVVNAWSCDFVLQLTGFVCQFALSLHALLCMTFHVIRPWGNVCAKFLRVR